MRVEGKVALISGGSRGIGAATAELLAAEGAAVVIGDVLRDEGLQTQSRINESGGSCTFLDLDVTDEANWERVVAATVSEYGKLDVLVNNAGISGRTRVEETDSELWDRVMDINAKGVFLGSKVAIPAMRSAGGGSIINISSIYGIVGSETSTAYHSSKGAVRLLTKATAVQYAREGNPLQLGPPRLRGQPHDRPLPRPARGQGRPGGPHSPGTAGRPPGHRLGHPLPGLRRVLIHDRKRAGH